MRKSRVWFMVFIAGVLLCGCSAREAADNTQATQTETSETDTVQTGDTQTEGNSTAGGAARKVEITEQDAFSTALAHADVDESKVTAKRIQRDYEDGKEVYEVEFYADGKEYDYDISVTDGSILKADFEIEDDFADAGAGKNQGSEGEISEEEAKKIALAKVPGAKKIQIKRDIEDGKPVYEGEIYYNNVEYEFEIDAATGKILSWEEDDD